jgi:RNA polymerase sigma-70 factor, ECF subfamily
VRDRPFAHYPLLNVHKFREHLGKMPAPGPEPERFGERFSTKRYLLPKTVSLVALAMMTKAGSGLSNDHVDRDHVALLAARAVTDRDAFGELYDLFAIPVFRYCYRRTGNREAAEDAMSQTFTRAFAAMPRFAGGSFPAWLYTIAHNVVINQARRPSFVPLPDEDRTIDPNPSPEEAVLIQDERSRIVRLLELLPEDQRRVVEFRLAGLTGPEIAEAMGKTLAAVKMLQLRAMRRLRTELVNCEPGGTDAV